MITSGLNWDKWNTVKKNLRQYQEAFNTTNVCAFSKGKNAKDYQEVLTNANLLLNYTFTYRKPLDMEACYIPYKMEPVNWLESPNGDPEWLFMLHRQEYLYDLLIAYFATNDPIYLERWKEFVFDWIESNPLNDKTKAIGWRTIDTGIRCFNWCKCLLLLLPLDFLTEEEEKRIMQSVRKQLIYIHESYIDKYDLSNWGALQVAGLFICESWFDDVLQLDLREWAMEKFQVQLFLQVNENGVHWEQSPLYQYETLFYLISVVHHADLTGYSLDNRFINRVKGLAHNSVYFVQPDGKLIPQSDTDQIDAGYLLTYAEIVLKERFIPFQEKVTGDVTVAWIVGWTTFEEYVNQEQLPPKWFDTDMFDPQTGNSWMRSDWKGNADFLSVHSGPIGSGHGHLDLGHFNYSYQGLPVYIDAGRYSYVDSPVRTYLKSAQAHNTIIVDEQNFSDAVGSWKYGKTATPQSFTFTTRNHISVTECIYSARLKDNSHYTVRRRYIFVKELSTVLISDFIMAKGDHQVRRLFHISPDVKLKEVSTKKLNFKTRNGTLQQHFFGDTETEVKSTFHSSIYNSLTNSKVIHACSSFTDFGHFLTVIAPDNVDVYTDEVQQSGTDGVVDPIYMEALVLQGRKRVSILHGQVDTVHGHKLYKYKGFSLYGKLNIINEEDTIERYL